VTIFRSWLVYAGFAVIISIVDSVAAQTKSKEIPLETAPSPKYLVVLDPGHGGSNTGGKNQVSGVLEKDVTLDMANKVAKILRKAGLQVLLTRTTDKTMTLRQRVDVANNAKADLFVSVHTNASPSRTQRGYESYVLTPTAVDVDGRSLRRNPPTPRPGLSQKTSFMLDDIERGAVQWEAAELAADMQEQLQKVRGKEGNRGVRQDSQHVLLGAVMPASLVEIGFLDHPVEGRELEDPSLRDQLATALAVAIMLQFPAVSSQSAKK
jgi:N-acetylmuramoyl-L-alanine amidase